MLAGNLFFFDDGIYLTYTVTYFAYFLIMHKPFRFYFAGAVFFYISYFIFYYILVPAERRLLFLVILGIDPGYATVGFGVLEYTANSFRTLTYGAVTTTPQQQFSMRLREIYCDICSLIDIYAPDAISIEELFFHTNQKTVIQVGQARGVIVLAAALREIPLFEYTPLQVKQSVVGYGRAEKKQVMEMTRLLLNLDKIPKPDDAADALALALCHAHMAVSKIPHISSL